MEAYDKIIKELTKVNNHDIAIGFFGERDSLLLTIVRANEYGANIVPKNSEALTIPAPPAKKGGRIRKPSEIDGLFRPRGKNVLARREGDSLVVYFYLVKRVKIPARSFIRTTQAENEAKYKQMFATGVEQIIKGQMTADQLFNLVGTTAVADMQNMIRKIRKPANAPVTVALKKSTNPLVDTGQMLRKVTFEVIPSGGGRSE